LYFATLYQVGEFPPGKDGYYLNNPALPSLQDTNFLKNLQGKSGVELKNKFEMNDQKN